MRDSRIQISIMVGVMAAAIVLLAGNGRRLAEAEEPYGNHSLIGVYGFLGDGRIVVPGDDGQPRGDYGVSTGLAYFDGEGHCDGRHSFNFEPDFNPGVLQITCT